MNVWHSLGLQASCRWLGTYHPIKLYTYFPARSVHCYHLSRNLRIAAIYHSLEILRIESRTTLRIISGLDFSPAEWFFHFVEQSDGAKSGEYGGCGSMVYARGASVCVVGLLLNGSHCPGATDPGVQIVLSAVATRLTGCPPCPVCLIMCFNE